jgi:predicted nucleic acid-binding protein
MGGPFERDAQFMSQRLLFDTSVWVDFFRNKRNPEATLLTDYISGNQPVLLIPTIIQEILQGIRDDAHFEKIKDILSYFAVQQIPPVQAAIGAAELYRFLRKKGITIKKSNDCLIAFHAIHFSIPLVHLDNDFEIIRVHSKLKTWKGR